MHSYEGPGGRTYHHSDEGSLEDVIHFNVTHQEFHVAGYVNREVEVTITMRDVLWLAARHLRDRAISRLEEASDEELIRLAAPLTAEAERHTRDRSHSHTLEAETSGSWDEAGETWTGPAHLAAEVPPGGPNLGGFVGGFGRTGTGHNSGSYDRDRDDRDV